LDINIVGNLSLSIQTKDGFSDMSGRKFVELFKVDTCNISSNPRSDSTASIANEIFYVEELDKGFLIFRIKLELPVVRKLK
jgi:hypothetical protein